MGIQGLLPFLENASRKAHVAEFRGSTVAIDAYCWLHKGAYGSAEKLIRGEHTDGYVLYCMKYLKMLKSFDIRPIMVFDGQHLPAKKQTEEKRREQRRNAKKKALDLIRAGMSGDARKYVIQSVDITHKMALDLIKECRNNGIDCIVAPYEADSQLAYLNMNKIADFVITEDSDLLLFGCTKILYKMDIQGFGTLVESEKINECMKLRQDMYSFDKFRYMCILSGCDYLSNLPGVGLKKALKFLSVTANPSIYDALPKMPSYLKLNVIMTDEYRESFMIADATFKYQLVFDPINRKLLPLNPIPPDHNMEYCRNAGDMFDSKVAFQLALGNIDPFTHEKVDDWLPSLVPLSSIWSQKYKKPEVSFRKVVKQEVKKESFIVEVAEEEKDEYDRKLQKELDQYKIVHTAKRAKVEEVEEELSPVLSKSVNVPFRNLKKMSKFERTVINYDQTVTSRFFKNKQEPQVECGTPPDSLLSSIDDFTKIRRSIESQSPSKSLQSLNESDLNSSVNVNDDEVEIQPDSPIKDMTNVRSLRSRFQLTKNSVGIVKNGKKLSLEKQVSDEENKDEENEVTEITEVVATETMVTKKVNSPEKKKSITTSIKSTKKVRKVTTKVPENQKSILSFFSAAPKKQC